MNAGNESTINRSTAPVFVLGSPRSGTTLLYDMLISSGHFAVYLGESNVFNLLVPRFGDLRKRGNRERLLNAWLGSKLFRATGLDEQLIRTRILNECKHGGDFLSIVMGEVAKAQGVRRWAENSPEAMLHLPTIKKLIPHALVVHIIRDGRDVAASLGRLRYVRAFPWEDRHSIDGCGLYWEWMVQRGRRFGKDLGADYTEVHFEDLMAKPRETLAKVGEFIGQELDYDKIQRVGYGSIRRPNTSFGQESPAAGFNPVGRWKKSLSSQQLVRLESLIGSTLTDLGYVPATGGDQKGLSAQVGISRWLHRSYFRAKVWYKNDPLIRMLRPKMTSADIDDIVLAEDHAPPGLPTSV